MKKHAPATLRNREAIAQALAEELPESGLVLEVASGSGEHAVFFAGRFAALEWQPSDPAGDAIASIAAYRTEFGGANLRQPLVLDASTPESWEVRSVDAAVCINMVHISDWAATIGLFKGAATVLGGKGLPLILYGPFFEHGIDPVPSNAAFDEGLRARNLAWGIRHVEDLDELAHANGFTRSARREMPANNLMLVYRLA